MTSTRNTASAMRAWRVIWPPQLPLTALSLITSRAGMPVLPIGWNVSNNACLSATSWAGSSASERMMMDAELPVPAACTVAGSAPITRS